MPRRCASGKIRNKRGKCVSRSRSLAMKRSWKSRSKSMSPVILSPTVLRRRMGPSERQMSTLSGRLTKNCVKNCNFSPPCIQECRNNARTRSLRRHEIIMNDPAGNNIAVEAGLMEQLKPVLTTTKIGDLQFSPEMQYHLGLIDYQTATQMAAKQG